MEPPSSLLPLPRSPSAVPSDQQKLTKWFPQAVRRDVQADPYVPEYSVLDVRICDTCRIERGLEGHHFNFEIADELQGFEWTCFCCYEEELRFFGICDPLQYFVKRSAPVDVQELARDLTVTTGHTHLLFGRTIDLARRLQLAEERIRVLLDMKRLGELDARKGKRKRRGSM